MKTNKKLFFIILALVLATLACNVSTSGTDPNAVQTQVALTVAAQQPAQGPAAPVNTAVPAAPVNTAVPAAPVNTAAPAATAVPTKPELSVSTNTNCRSGPGIKYPITGSILTNGTFEIVARPPGAEPYLIIKNPGGGADCWAWLEYATVTGDTSSLPTLAVPPIPLGSIAGFVWVEDCDDINPATTGCIMNTNSGIPEGDGFFNNELLLADIVVDLFTGSCSSGSSLGTKSTNLNGAFKFDKLEAGDYCIVIDTFKYGNDSILIQAPGFGGGWTAPNRNSTVQTFAIKLLPGEHLNGFGFGWDDFEQ